MSALEHSNENMVIWYYVLILTIHEKIIHLSCALGYIIIQKKKIRITN